MKRTYLYSALAALLLALVAFLFFFPDDVEGNVLQQHDILQGLANGQEGKAFYEATGESTRWTNSLFGGMPNFQIAPSYPANSMLSWIGKLYTLWLPSPANLLFGMMLGFFLMCLCMKMKWYTSLFAALAWGFSSYFIIIIGAGHIWKFVTLSYIPPTIGGIILLYRGRYLAGTAMAALFGALQLQSNHPQMSYYFMFVIIAMMIAWLCKAIKKHEVKQWLQSTGLTIVAGILALAANSASLYNTYEYSKETVRGRATELSAGNPGGETSGMDRDAITAWSYGIDETWSLLIPNVKGGATIKPVAGENTLLSINDLPKSDEYYLSSEQRQFVSGFPQYFGNQPMTNGPVYVGAFVLLLAILALFIVKTPMKWALFAVSVLSVFLAWGHNFNWFTNLFIDYFPGYNRFRTVSSILVIIEFTIPLLAALCLKEIMSQPDDKFGQSKFYDRNKWTIICVMGFGIVVCLIGWIMPSAFGDAFTDREIEMLTQQGYFSMPELSGLWQTVRQLRYSLVSADSLRSLIFILVGCLILWMWFKGVIRNRAVFVCCLSALVIIDLFSVNKRYVNSENFIAATDNEQTFNMTDADREILKDTGNYRVMDINGFGEARSSYFHKTIGGYHAAKLTRYNDLITHQITKGNPGVLNMLNAKYFLYEDQYQQNPDALGNAWFVDRIDYVDTPDAEMSALDSLNTATDAVADAKFRNTLGAAAPKAAGDTIYETSYAPNKLTYKAKSQKGGVAMFSEIYFPWGWNVTIDGQPVSMGRANYVLRALRIPSGTHDIVFTFDPQSLRTTNVISIIAVILIYVIVLGALSLLYFTSIRKTGKEPEKSSPEKLKEN